ncbi:DUF7312 domain-containing protein [Halorubrum yunnanense]|uniref:DUF7312 domain-containing protein n=1 Tax=Halorubrum yunnanense TaxID=1526162 RepID=A0ABD5YFT4_9EURY|nr:hypothetical protein [Halorubrum yunnanense]
MSSDDDVGDTADVDDIDADDVDAGGNTRSRANESRDADGDDERQWRFAVDDVGPDGVTEDTATPEDEPIEPGSIDAENAALVALGVAVTVGVLLFGF